MCRLIPSWSIGILGASIVVISISLSPLIVRDLENNIEDTENTISELNRRVRTLWANHTLAAQREAAADTIAALITLTDAPHPFVISRSGAHLQGAILTMWAATGDEDDTNLQSTVSALMEKLNAGQLNSYDSMSAILDVQRLRSADVVNELYGEVADYEARLRELRKQRDRIRALQSFLNIVGLIVVLLKDLPIWKRKGDGNEIHNSPDSE